jgi:hypothetical protein
MFAKTAKSVLAAGTAHAVLPVGQIPAITAKSAIVIAPVMTNPITIPAADMVLRLGHRGKSVVLISRGVLLNRAGQLITIG